MVNSIQSRGLVSVIIPTYNRCGLVQQAIDSVLAQDYKSYEIIVVDDGSDDDTREVLTRLYGKRIIYQYQRNQGESVARNTGISLASGEYIAFLDSDDLWHPKRLTRHVAVLDASPEVDLIASPAYAINAEGVYLGYCVPVALQGVGYSPTLENLVRVNHIISPSIVTIRRSALPPQPIFDPTIKFAEDWDLWLRIVARHSALWLDEPLAYIRIHSGGQRQWMPPLKDAERVFSDHMRLLDKVEGFFDEPTLSLQEALRESRAAEYGKSAFVYYAHNRVDLAKERLARAIDLDPQTWKNAEQIKAMALNRILSWAELQPIEDQMKAAIDCARRIFENLPRAITAYQAYYAATLAHAYVDLGFAALARGRYHFARRFFIQALRYDPRWLCNRGVVAGLVHTLRRKDTCQQLLS